MLPRKDILWLAGIVAVAVLGGLVLHAYIGNRVDVAQYEQLKQDQKTQIETLRQDLAVGLQRVQDDQKAAQTPDEIAAFLQRYMKLQTQPVVIQVPAQQPMQIAPTQGAVAAPSTVLPNAPSFTPTQNGGLYIAPVDVPTIRDFTASCAECSLKLPEVKEENRLLKERVEKAEKTMKGGSLFTRVKRNAKWLGIGLVVGGSAALAAKH